MKIAIFHNLPSGGGIRMLHHIIQKYRRHNEIDVYVASEKLPKDIIGIKNYYYHLKPWTGFLLRNLWICVYLPWVHKMIAQKIDKKEYDLVLLSHDYFTKSPYLLRYIKTKSVYLCQESQREFYESWKIHSPTVKDKLANIIRIPIKYIDRSNVRMADIILCNSKYSKKIIEGIYRKKCQVIYPGVDIKLFNPKIGKKKGSILCIGGINTVKDQYFLINAIKPILKRYTLILVGNGRRQDLINLRNVSKKLKVKLFKNITDLELRDLYRNSLVTCITAHFEPFGLSSIESQACGTPVVAINEGGPMETIIDGKTGYLVKRDEKEFLCKVREAIKKNKTLGSNALHHIEKNWTWERTLKPLDKIFLQ